VDDVRKYLVILPVYGNCKGQLKILLKWDIDSMDWKSGLTRLKKGTQLDGLEVDHVTGTGIQFEVGLDLDSKGKVWWVVGGGCEGWGSMRAWHARLWYP
jgi:hypothetical protein